MQIRTRLTLQFLIIGGAIMIIASCAIYFFSARFRQEDFYNRLENKASNTAKLLIEVDEIDVNLLRRIERDNPVNLPSEKIIIFNYKNEIIYSSDELKEIDIPNSLVNRIRLYERITFTQDGHEVLGLLYTERYDRFVVIAAARDNDGLKNLKYLGIILIFVNIISLVIFSVAGWFYSGRALEPISGVVRQVEDISITSLNLRVDEGNGSDEIARLAKTFNNMLDRLEEAFKVQKNFISNASHEIRTPLTSVYGQLQVLLMKDRKKEDYKAAVSSVVDDIKGLIELSNSLLLLAQTSSEQADKFVSQVRIDDILWQAAEEIRKVNSDYIINIHLANEFSSGDTEKLVVRGNEFLLKVAVSNLIENACKYSDNHAVNVCIEPHSNLVSVVFQDNGRGIDKDDIDKIFEPFHRGKNAKAIHGQGIGLSLVHRIIKNHNGTISLSSEIGIGTKIFINLPLE